jgi:beta-galactosidase
MFNLPIGVVVLAGLLGLPAAQDPPSPGPPDWENPAVFRVGKLESHATLMAFDSAEGALSGERFDSNYSQLLNGTWSFQWVPTPADRPADFWRADFDDSDWAEITVPSNVELEGYGTPLYNAHAHPFRWDPPLVMGVPPESWTTFAERNPVSSYRRTFQVDPKWQGRRVLIAFEGVSSAFYLWCNGQKVGYSQDSRTTAEFDLTEMLVSGTNSIAVEVYRYSDGSYLESHDEWRLSGIYRDVYLHSKAMTDLFDLKLETELDVEAQRASLTVTPTLGNDAGHAVTVFQKAWLVDPLGQVSPPSGTTSEVEALTRTSGNLGRLKFEIEAVRAWTPTHPALYTLVQEFYEVRGLGEPMELLSAYRTKVGFKRLDVMDGELQLNGKALLVKGVNLTAHDPLTGHQISEERIRQDLVLMKQSNINAVRTPNGPCSPRFLELCDEYGLLVWSGANLNSDSNQGEDSDLRGPAWVAARLDRVVNMLQRDKNHTCIAAFTVEDGALGAESFEEAAAMIGGAGPPKLALNRNTGDPGSAAHQANGPSELDSLQGWSRSQELLPPAERSSLIHAEYSRAMGNSSGGMADSWEVFRRTPYVQGGFISSWVDQGLWTSGLPSARLKGDKVRAHEVVLWGEVIKGRGLVSGFASVESAKDLMGTDGFTIAVILSPMGSDCNSGGNPIMVRGASNWGLRIGEAADQLEFFVFDGGYRSLLVPLPEDWSTRRQHVLASYDGAELILYSNDSELGRLAWKGAPAQGQAPLIIGAKPRAAGQGFFGDIHAVALWERALTLAEVVAPSMPQDGLALDISFSDFEPAPEQQRQWFYGFGGDFGDFPNRGNTCVSGLVMPDRSASPQLAEVKRVYQDYQFSLGEQVSLDGQGDFPGALVNVSWEAASKRCSDQLHWQLSLDGQELTSGRMPLNSEIVRIPAFELPKPGGAGELFLTVAAELGEANLWAPAGFEIAWEQFWIGGAFVYSPRTEDDEVWSVERDGTTTLHSGKVAAQFDDRTGALVSLRVNRADLLAGPLRPNFWRPPVDNDLAGGSTERFARWRDAGREGRVQMRSLDEIGQAVSISYDIDLGTFGPESRGTVQLVWTMHPGGALELIFNLHPSTLMDGSPGELARIGMICEVPSDFDTWSWYGLGPHETYLDRISGAQVGRYSGAVADLFHPYLAVQESGNRMGVRTASFLNSDGHGLRISSPFAMAGTGLFGVGAYPGLLSDFEGASHPLEPSKRDVFSVCIDVVQAAVAGSGVWGAQTISKYKLLGNREYTFQLYIEAQ